MDRSSACRSASNCLVSIAGLPAAVAELAGGAAKQPDTVPDTPNTTSRRGIRRRGAQRCALRTWQYGIEGAVLGNGEGSTVAIGDLERAVAGDGSAILNESAGGAAGDAVWQLA